MSRTVAQQRERLVQRMAELTGRSAALSVHLRGADGRHDADSEDVVSFTEGDEVVEGLDHAARAELDQIRAALYRIEHDSYGVCVDCGESIEPARLDALPQAPMCVGCAAKSQV
ncbi:MAG: TraR/DksA family transcriptional regulator [Myxococcota bacterium]